MALASRNSRSNGGRRLLIAALVVTILVVLLDASLKSRSPTPAQTLSADTWVDRVMPLIAASNAEGRELAQLRTSGLGTPAARITTTLDALAAEAGSDYRLVASYGSPQGVGGAAGLLEACLLARSRAATTLVSGVTAVLASPTAQVAAPSAVSAVATAGAQLVVADQAYALFSSTLPRSLGVTVPASTWIDDDSQYQPAALQVWLVALRSGTSLVPVHQLTVDAVTTSPPPVGIAAGVQDIPPTRSLSVTAVVADTGNQAENDLTVTVALTPGARGASSSVRGFASLAPGTSEALTLGPLVAPSGVATSLTVTVQPLAGSPTPPATTTLPIEVAPPPPPTTTTTTTTAPTTSTTRPPGPAPAG